MQGDKGTGTGYPGKKRGVGGGLSKDAVIFEAEKAATTTVGQHETVTNPHPQYTTESEVVTLITENAPVPRFATYWKWS